MTNIEKIIQGLKCCISGNPAICKRVICPYAEEHNGIGYTCIDHLMTDALALLKAQEPRLVIESDFEDADEYGYIPVWTEEKDGDMYWECIPKIAITDSDDIGVFRYWTSRPTDEQREVEPWDY